MSSTSVLLPDFVSKPRDKLTESRMMRRFCSQYVSGVRYEHADPGFVRGLMLSDQTFKNAYFENFGSRSAGGSALTQCLSIRLVHLSACPRCALLATKSPLPIQSRTWRLRGNQRLLGGLKWVANSLLMYVPPPPIVVKVGPTHGVEEAMSLKRQAESRLAYTRRLQ